MTRIKVLTESNQDEFQDINRDISGTFSEIVFESHFTPKIKQAALGYEKAKALFIPGLAAVFYNFTSQAVVAKNGTVSYIPTIHIDVPRVSDTSESLDAMVKILQSIRYTNYRHFISLYHGSGGRDFYISQKLKDKLGIKYNGSNQKEMSEKLALWIKPHIERGGFIYKGLKSYNGRWGGHFELDYGEVKPEKRKYPKPMSWLEQIWYFVPDYMV